MRIRITFEGPYPFSCSIPVRVTDLNYGGHVGNDRILAYAQEARMAFLKQWGYTELDAGGKGLIMADTAVQYKGEAFYGDLLSVEVGVDEIKPGSFELYYRMSTVRHGSTVLIAFVKTGMVCFDYTSRQICPMPEDLATRLQTCKP